MEFGNEGTCGKIRGVLAHFLTTYCDAIRWTGLGISIVGSLWFLFASYHCDVDLARWTLLFPPVALFLVVRYPETCLRPFLVVVVSMVLMGVGSAYAPPSTTPTLALPPGLQD